MIRSRVDFETSKRVKILVLELRGFVFQKVGDVLVFQVSKHLPDILVHGFK
jgi:hypothetical protein